MNSQNLREITGVNQDVYQQHKRWFTCDEMDLFVWHDDSNIIVSFQLCYDKSSAEKALMWTNEAQFSHFYVDEGSQPGNHPASPLFAEHSEFNKKLIADSFSQRCVDIDEEVSEYIIGTLFSS